MAENKSKNEKQIEQQNKEEVINGEEILVEDIKTPKELEASLNELKEENKKYYEHLQRTAAEFDNYKKRVSKEKERIYNLAVGDIVLKYIPVLDNIEKAINAETSDEKMKEGVQLIRKQILDIMAELKIEVIETVGKPFNPEIHDAVMHIESEEHGEKEVIEELRKGYKMGDRVIRHAMVKVAN